MPDAHRGNSEDGRAHAAGIVAGGGRRGGVSSSSPSRMLVTHPRARRSARRRRLTWRRRRRAGRAPNPRPWTGARRRRRRRHRLRSSWPPPCHRLRPPRRRPPRVAPPPSPPAPAPAPPRAAGGASGPTRGIMPPGHPPASIPPQPNFLAVVFGRGLRRLLRPCVNATLAAIDNGRRAEGLPAMALPANWTALTSQEQLYVATNLERTVRGLPPLSALARVLDQAAAAGADAGQRPAHRRRVSPSPSGVPTGRAAWGAPSRRSTTGCTTTVPVPPTPTAPPANSSGCWGHRYKILHGALLRALCHGGRLRPHTAGGASRVGPNSWWAPRAPRRPTSPGSRKRPTWAEPVGGRPRPSDAGARLRCPSPGSRSGPRQTWRRNDGFSHAPGKWPSDV